jgi:hypothetical protein
VNSRYPDRVRPATPPSAPIMRPPTCHDAAPRADAPLPGRVRPLTAPPLRRRRLCRRRARRHDGRVPRLPARPAHIQVSGAEDGAGGSGFFHDHGARSRQGRPRHRDPTTVRWQRSGRPHVRGYLRLRSRLERSRIARSEAQRSRSRTIRRTRGGGVIRTTRFGYRVEMPGSYFALNPTAAEHRCMADSCSCRLGTTCDAARPLPSERTLRRDGCHRLRCPSRWLRDRPGSRYSATLLVFSTLAVGVTEDTWPPSFHVTADRSTGRACSAWASPTSA